MSWLEKQKKRYIRWYYGEFVNDPRAEIIMFGLIRSRGARRMDKVMAFIRRLGF